MAIISKKMMKNILAGVTAFNANFTPTILPNGKEGFMYDEISCEDSMEAMSRIYDTKTLTSLKDVQILANYLELLLRGDADDVCEATLIMMHHRNVFLDLMKQGREICDKAKDKSKGKYADVWETFGVNFSIFKNAITMLMKGKFSINTHSLRVVGNAGNHICYAVTDKNNDVSILLMVTA